MRPCCCSVTSTASHSLLRSQRAAATCCRVAAVPVAATSCARSSSRCPAWWPVCRLPARSPFACTLLFQRQGHSRFRPQPPFGSPAVLNLLPSLSPLSCLCAGFFGVGSAESCPHTWLHAAPSLLPVRAVRLCLTASNARFILRALQPVFCCAFLYVCLFSVSLRARCRCVRADAAFHPVVLRLEPALAASHARCFASPLRFPPVYVSSVAGGIVCVLNRAARIRGLWF